MVVPDDEPIAYVLGAVERAGLQLSDEQVVEILDAGRSDYEAIGALGRRSQISNLQLVRAVVRALPVRWINPQGIQE